jgi:hypothetical protein
MSKVNNNSVSLIDAASDGLNQKPKHEAPHLWVSKYSVPLCGNYWWDVT